LEAAGYSEECLARKAPILPEKDQTAGGEAGNRENEQDSDG
jgi:hypothetical protein